MQFQDFFGSTIERHPPVIVVCDSPLRGYHGTSASKAESILKGGFEGYEGRAGWGVYFFEGGENAFKAAKEFTTAKCKSHGDSQAVVIESTIRVRKVLDLDSADNNEFVSKMHRQIRKWILQHRPRDRWMQHDHYIGFVVQKCIGHVRGLDALNAIRTSFSYSDGFDIERGIVVLDPKNAVENKVVLGLASC